MADLGFLDYDLNSTVSAINCWYGANNKQRRHLGLSQAGNDCARFLWYAHNGFDQSEIDGRTLRLFQLGNVLEDQTIIDLKSAGFSVTDQQKSVTLSRDKTVLTGSIDGIVTGLLEAPKTPHLFEHKTCSDKSFKKLKKFVGTTDLSRATTFETSPYKHWNEVYYWQVQFYMMGLKLKRAAVFIYNKNNSELYMERIVFDKDATILKLNSIFDAIESKSEPARKCPNSSWFAAKYCNFYSECFK